MSEIEKKLKATIELELEKCSIGLYPNMCQLKQSESGREKIFNMVKAIVSETPMNIKSALAQVESSL